MINFRKILLIFLFPFVFIKPTYGQSTVLINEFLIDPQPQQVEIINTSSEEADISGWIIDDSGGTTYYTIPQSSILYSNSCLVFSGDFNLNKSSPDTVRLINNSQLIDYFSYKSSSGSGITYYRLPDGTDTWTTGSANLGKFNSSRERACLFPTVTPTLMPTLIITPTVMQIPTEMPTCTGQACLIPTLTPQSYDNIYLSEAMVYPQPGNNEWIEIFNDNDFPVSLDNWLIDDIENGGSTPKSFSADIPAKSYFALNLPSSMFNNGGDSVRLLDNNKNLKDSFEYAGRNQGKTFGRTSLDNDDFCQQEPSIGTINNPCINSTPTITPMCTDQVCLTPTMIIKMSTIKLISPTKLVSINQLIDTKKSAIPIKKVESGKVKSGEVLGTSDILSTDSSNNKSLINTLLFLSCSYSLLTMMSILIKMRLIYEKTGRTIS